MNKTVQGEAISNRLREFITLHANDNIQELALQRLRYPEIEDWQWVLQQIAGRQLMQKKLPSIAQIEDWHYPVRLSLEQCSSERTAEYKKQLLMSQFQELTISPNLKIADLTGGFGIDSYFFSQLPNAQVDYIEQNEELCHIAEHNFTLTHRPVRVHNTTAEDFLQLLNQQINKSIIHTLYDLIYLDPARRGGAGQKVFRLQDCSPNVLTLMPLLYQSCRFLLLKLSPMIDLNLLLKQLPTAREIHILAVLNEVKEVLVLIDFCHIDAELENTPITCTNILHEGRHTFTFTQEEEQNLSTINCNLSTINFLFEPNAAIMKAGAFNTISMRCGCQSLDKNTHLYVSEHHLPDFPGRRFHVIEQLDKPKQKMLRGQHFNVLTRNYPIAADKLQKQLGIISGGEHYIIGTRLQNKPVLLLAELL